MFIKVTLLNIISMKEKTMRILKTGINYLNDKLQNTDYIIIKIEEL